MADNATPAVATPAEVTAFRSEQEKEWNTYVAVEPISFNGVRAYNVGDPVPASNVAQYGYEADKLVVKVGTKTGDAAIARVVEAATPTNEPPAAPVSLNVTVPQ